MRRILLTFCLLASLALHTFVVQLACAADIYLPTERALEAGGYGAEVTVSKVGPEGGRELVDRTVELINGMWGKSPLDD